MASSTDPVEVRRAALVDLKSLLEAALACVPDSNLSAMAALARELRAVVRELHELGPGGEVLDSVDEIKRKRAARIAGTAPVGEADGRGVVGGGRGGRARS